MGIRRWWHDHRAVYRLKDGQWVPAPRRIERAWAWLMHRGRPRRPPPRVFWIIWIATLVASEVWGGDWGWWLFEHPQVARDIRTGLYTICAVGVAGVLFSAAGLFLGYRRRARITRKARDASRLPPPK